jgi:arabinan endo-1,5-alpha-L-arabinosidase
MEKKSTQNMGILRKCLSTIIGVFLLAAAIHAQAPSHDPSTMIRNTDGRYWIFTTGQGIWCMSSATSDFSSWRAETTPFGSSYPSWIASYVKGFTGFFWAPDVIKIGNYYYLYYSCAGEGAAAAIGVTRATNLAGPWTDQGMIVAGNNAIDPAVYMDNGRLWMAWGNWQSGLDICELNPSTGKRLNSTKYHLVDGQVEGPGLTKNGSYYYLFYQRGLCCNGVNSTYYMVVARSSKITGPYTDERVFLPNKNGNIIGPGHFGYGEGKLTYHYYDGNDNGAAKLKIGSLQWSNGWPVTSGTPGSGTITSGGVYRITPRHSGKALDVASCGSADGTNVQQWSWLNNDCQKWIMTSVSSGVYRISPANASGMALDVTNCSNANNTNIQLWSWLNNDCQKWTLVSNNGYYQIKNVATGKCLNISGSSTADGANAVLYDCGSGNNNLFSFTSTSSLKSGEVEEAEVEELMLNNAKNEDIQVYPNPSNGSFSVDMSRIKAGSKVFVRIVDMQGRMVYQSTVSSEDKLTINNGLEPGSYIIYVQLPERTIVQKVVIR